MGLAAWLFGARTKRKWGFDEALTHWEREGKQKGDAEAARCVGLCYQLGHGCIKDEKQAFTWYLRGAMHGDVLSALRRLDVRARAGLRGRRRRGDELVRARGRGRRHRGAALDRLDDR